MKPYDKSNSSFVQRVTKRVSDILPGTTWVNKLLGESRPDDNPPLTSDSNDQPPVKKLCTSNNTFVNTSNRTYVDTSQSMNSTDNHRNSHVNVLLPEISAGTCLPGTSRQSPKFTNQSNSSSVGQDIGNKSSFKRKADVIELSNINRQCPNAVALNFASSTPTLVTANKQPVSTSNLKRLNSETLSINNEYLTSTSSNLLKPRGNESQSMLTFRNTTKPYLSSPSFRWDTFVNYGELSERQRLFANRSPLNCSKVMYGGNSAYSNLSKIFANTPAIHNKSVIPICPTTNNQIRTTSSILLGHISTKDKEIEENKFIIQPRNNIRHKANQKVVNLKVETIVKVVDSSPEKTNDTSSMCFGRDTPRKIRTNISKKTLGQGLEFEMPAKIDLPNISLPMSVLPSIKLSNNCDEDNDKDNNEDNEFTFNQPLTIEQFSLQIAEKTCKKKQKMNLKKTQNSPTTGKNHHSSSFGLSPTFNKSSTHDTLKIENEQISVMKNNISIDSLPKNEKVPELFKVSDNSKNIPNKSVQSSGSKLESTDTVNVVLDNSQVLKCNNKSEQPEKLTAELKKCWTCDSCWVSNNSDKTNCIACQSPKPGISQKPLEIVKSSTWTCETCWVPNKNEIDACVACQTQKPGTIKKVVKQSNWTCDACWVTNKIESTKCISCGTVKPGSSAENKPEPSTEFKFGLNNNDTFDKSGSSQFKFGVDSGKTDQPSSQFKFGSTIFKTDNKSDASTGEFKFGMINNETDKPLSTFKFGIDSSTTQTSDVTSSSNNTKQPSNQFKFGFEKKSDQPKSQFKFGLSTQFKFGSDNIESEKSVQQKCVTDSNKVAQSTNESQFLVNNKSEKVVKEKSIDLPNRSSLFKFGDAKQTDKSTLPLTFGTIETNCNNSNSLVNVNKNEDLSKGNLIWDKKDNLETKLTSTSQTIPSSIENTFQLVNGHSHTNEKSNEDPKPGLLKTSQFSFSTLSKQDINLPDDQKKHKTFTFGSTVSDKPLLVTSSFPNTVPVFGASNSIFSSGLTTSSPATLGSVSTPQFSFGSMAPPASNSFFSKNIKDNDKNPFAQNSFASTTNLGFSFGSQSPPVFSIPNSGGLLKSSIEANDPSKSTPNNIFNLSSTKPIKLDPNAPISINFTGGATTQFTAKPETTEPPTKRKILKPIRKIR